MSQQHPGPPSDMHREAHEDPAQRGEGRESKALPNGGSWVTHHAGSGNTGIELTAMNASEETDMF